MLTNSIANDSGYRNVGHTEESGLRYYMQGSEQFVINRLTKAALRETTDELSRLARVPFYV